MHKGKYHFRRTAAATGTNVNCWKLRVSYLQAAGLIFRPADGSLVRKNGQKNIWHLNILTLEGQCLAGENLGVLATWREKKIKIGAGPRLLQ